MAAPRQTVRSGLAAFGFAVVLGIAVAACTSSPPLAPTSLSAATCVASGDETAINAALAGPTGTAALCPNAVFELHGPVVFTRDGQRLYTQGFPTGETRATLRVVAPTLDTALILKNRSGVHVSHIIVDGNRPLLGWIPGGDSLIAMGGDAVGQRLEYVRAFEPRGWTSVHAWEGEGLSCAGVTIAHSEFGPAGQPNGAWADGISLACRASHVHHNTITDATDGGIVVFGAPGSVVAGNTIRAVARRLLGGILMVDHGPFGGDFTGTVVDANVIDGAGEQIRIGLAMGTQTWTCRPGAPRLFGAFVSHNVLQGNLGYGYAVSGVSNWTVADNAARGSHTGTPVRGCDGQLPSAPGPFQIDPTSSSGTFQDEFEDALLDSALFAFGDPAVQPYVLRSGARYP